MSSGGGSKPFTLALYASVFDSACDDVELLRLRVHWVPSRIVATYVQEVAPHEFMAQLSVSRRARLLYTSSSTELAAHRALCLLHQAILVRDWSDKLSRHDPTPTGRGAQLFSCAAEWLSGLCGQYPDNAEQLRASFSHRVSWVTFEAVLKKERYVDTVIIHLGC